MSSPTLDPSSIVQWAPDRAIFKDIINLLRQADSPNTEVQRRLAQAVGQLEALVDAPCYFCFMLVDETSEADEVRQRAGLLLKNRISELMRRTSQRTSLGGEAGPYNQLTQEELAVLSYVKRNVIRALSDRSRVIRETAGTILAAIVGSHGIQDFPAILPSLYQLLDHSAVEIQKGAFSALSKIIEDELDRNAISSCYYSVASTEPQADAAVKANASFVDFCKQKLIPKLLHVATPQHGSSLRRLALICLNHFQRNNLFSPTEIFDEFFELYWNCLGVLALDSSSEIRLAALQGVSQVTQMQSEVMLRSLASVMPFLLDSLSLAQPYELRFEALELLSHLINHHEAHATIESFLPRLLQLLVENSKYSQFDYLQLDQTQFDDDNAGMEDRAQDIAPRFHQSRGEADNESESDSNEMKTAWGEGWTARKWSAQMLDHLSFLYRDLLLPFILPELESRLQHQDWEVKESAVLVLGAISRGCLNGLELYLPKILELLVGLCDDKKPILRTISLWCLGRFSVWIESRTEIMRVVTATILKHLLDSNKKVQQSACSAFASLEEGAGSGLVVYLPDILETFSRALNTFQTNNMIVLLDAIGTLAESLGSKVDIPLFHEKVCDPLVQLWLSHANIQQSEDPLIIAAFESMSCVCLAIPKGLPKYASSIVQRGVVLIRQSLIPMEETLPGASIERPQRQLIECTLDLFSALTETLKSEIGCRLAETDFLDLLEKCCSLPTLATGSTVKQSAFALIGDLSEKCPNYIRPRIPVLVPYLIPYIAIGSHNVCNNASWAIGQIALHVAVHHELDPWALEISRELTNVLQSPIFPEALIRNAGITLGRLACSSSIQEIEQSVHPIFGRWCRILETAPNDREKIYAFNGLCHVVNNHDQLAVDHMPALLDAICSLYFSHQHSFPSPNDTPHQDMPLPPSIKVPSETHEVFLRLITWLHSSHTTEWSSALTHLKPATTLILNSWIPTSAAAAH